MKEGFRLRPATLEDIPILVKHRRWMFDEINIRQNYNYTAESLHTMDTAYTLHLQEHLKAGSLYAWVVEKAGRVVASGAVSIVPWPALPGDSSQVASHLHSMFTDPEQRGKGLARQIVDTAIDFCKTRGISWMMLAASDAGRPLYESMGFKPYDREMHLRFD